jgi:hypothetical protein
VEGRSTAAAAAREREEVGEQAKEIWGMCWWAELRVMLLLVGQPNSIVMIFLLFSISFLLFFIFLFTFFLFILNLFLSIYFLFIPNNYVLQKKS